MFNDVPREEASAEQKARAEEIARDLSCIPDSHMTPFLRAYANMNKTGFAEMHIPVNNVDYTVEQMDAAILKLQEEEANKVPEDIEDLIRDKMDIILRAFRRIELSNAEIIQRLDRLENRMAVANIGGELAPISNVPSHRAPHGRAYLEHAASRPAFDLSRGVR